MLTRQLQKILAQTSGDYQYRVSGSNATITGCTGLGDGITITETNDGYKAFYTDILNNTSISRKEDYSENKSI